MRLTAWGFGLERGSESPLKIKEEIKAHPYVHVVGFHREQRGLKRVIDRWLSDGWRNKSLTTPLPLLTPPTHTTPPDLQSALHLMTAPVTGMLAAVFIIPSL